MTALLHSTVQVLLMGMALQSARVIDPPTTEYVRQLAVGDRRCHLVLLKFGVAAFPAYETILTDPKSELREIAGVLSALIFVDVPKGHFLTITVPFLSYEDIAVRVTAVGLMEQLGTPEEGSILVALLSDEDKIVANAAATALAKTGGRRELIAMDAWLRTGSAHRKDGILRAHVKKCRDELEKRLKANPIPKDLKH